MFQTVIRRLGRIGLIQLAALSLLSTSASAAGTTQFLWSDAIKLDSGSSLTGLDCVSTTQCIAVDQRGREVSFVANRTASPTPQTIDSGKSLHGVSCTPGVHRSAFQCVTVDTTGKEVTFDPDLPSGASSAQLSGNPLDDVACSSTGQCVAVDNQGNELTFAPLGPAQPTPAHAVDPGHALEQVACPSDQQCTAVDDAGREVTFNPGTPGSVAPVDVDGTSPLVGLSCPSTTQCTAVDPNGHEVTFNPMAPGTPTPVSVDTRQLTAVSCSSSAQCTATDFQGNEVTFNPTAPGSPKPNLISAGDALTRIACPSDIKCVAVDGNGNAFAGLPIRATSHRAARISQTTALLRGQVETAGTGVTWQFQWGRTSNYNKATPIRTIPAGRGTVQVSWKLLHLQPNTLYHVRLVAITGGAKTSAVESFGDEVTFTTKSTGQLVLVGRTFKLSGGSIGLPLRCQSNLACKGRFNIGAKAKVGQKKKLGSVLCNSSSFNIPAHATQVVSAGISNACQSLIKHAAGHHLTAQFTSRPRTGQAGIVTNLTLRM